MLKWEKPKDPDDVLDYRLDLADWLAGDTITAATVTVASGGVTLGAKTVDAAGVSIWISGGANGEAASLLFRVTTAGGCQKDFTVALDIATA